MKFYILTNKKETKYSFQYKDGLNVCDHDTWFQFDFFNEIQLLKENYHYHNFYYIREVTIPEDTEIYHGIGSSRANKIILGPRKIFNSNPQDFINFDDPAICLVAVKQHGCALKYVKEQTLEFVWQPFNKMKMLYDLLKFDYNLTENSFKSVKKYLAGSDKTMS